MIKSYRGAVKDADSAELPDELKENMLQRVKNLQAASLSEGQILVAAAHAGSADMLEERWKNWISKSWSKVTARRSFAALLNGENYVPLVHAVVDSGSLVALKWLVEHGLDVTVCHETGQNYGLAFAKQFNKPAMTEYLLSKGATNTVARMQAQAVGEGAVGAMLFSGYFGFLGTTFLAGMGTFGSSVPIAMGVAIGGGLVGGAAIGAGVVVGASHAGAAIYNHTFARRARRSRN